MQKKDTIRKWAATVVILGLVACGDVEERKAKYMQQGNELFAEGRYDKALLAFKNVLQIDPKDSESRLQLAETLAKQGSLREAFAHYRAIIAADEGHVMSRVRAGKMFLMGRNIEIAEKLMQEAVALAPENSEVLVLQGAVFLVKGKLEEATSTIEKAMQNDPESSAAVLMRASIFTTKNEIDPAIEVLKKGLLSSPDNETIHLLLAKLYSQKNLNDKVESEFKQLIEIRPDSLEHYKRLLAFYMADEQLLKAENVLRSAMKNIPDDDNAEFYLIDFLSKKYGLDKALTELKLLIEQSPENYAFRFKLAAIYMDNEQMQLAEDVLDTIVKLDGEGISGIKARNGLARMYATTERGGEAKAMIKAVLEDNPRDAEALTLRGQFALKENKMTAAIADFRAAIVGQPDDVKLLKLLASAQMGNNEAELALENLKKVVAVAPDDIAARRGVIELLFESGKPLQAESDVLALLKLSAKDQKALESLFEIRVAQEKWEDARAIADKIQQVEDDPAKGYYLNARVSQAAGQWQESIKPFKQVLALKPGAVEPLTQLVKSYLVLGQVENAISFLTAVVKDLPDHFVAYNLLGEVFLRNKRLSEAEKAFQQAVKIKPEWFSAYRNLALLSMIKKDKDSAVSILLTGIDKTQGAVELIDILSALYKKEGNTAGVIKLYEEARDRNPDSVLVANNLASYLAEYGGDQESLDRAEAIAEPLAISNNPNLLDTVAWIAYKQGKLDKAQKLLESAIELGSTEPEINYHLGMVYHKQGDKAMAQSYLQKAVSKGASYSGIDQAKEILEGIKSSG